MLNIQIVLFLTAGLAIIFSLHYFLYFSTVSFFKISEIFYRRILLGALVFLSISFFLSSFLVRFYEFFLTKAFYFVSGFWWGLGLNFIMASVLLWIIIGSSRIFDKEIDRTAWALVFFGAAFLFSIYGVWNAFNLREKNITVSIPNLSENWRGKKVVQISDSHLGFVHKEGLIKSMVEHINAVEPEAVFITGDFFDGMDGRFDFVTDYLKEIKSKNGIFFVTGNHETYLGVNETISLLKKAGVKVLNNEVVDLSGLKIIGLSYPEGSFDGGTAAVGTIDLLKKDYYGRPNILLYHSPSLSSEFEEAGVNLQLSGHTHGGQIFPINFIQKFIYKNHEYGLYNLRDFTLYVTSGAGTWGPPMRTAAAPEIVVITLE